MNKLFVGVLVGVVAYVVYDKYMDKETTTTTNNNDKQPDQKRGCCYDVAVKGVLLNKRNLSVA